VLAVLSLSLLGLVSCWSCPSPSRTRC